MRFWRGGSYSSEKFFKCMSVFVIAEVGINHNGNLQIAKDLIKVAKDAGCDAVKFQKRTIDKVYSKEMLDQPRQSPWGTTQRDQKKGLEFGHEDFFEIDRYCKELGINWLASAWDIDSQKFLQQFNLKYNKVASPMLVYEDLLREIAAEKRKTFISTGMSSFSDIDQAVEIFRQADCPFELMHCVSTYPLKDENANLNCIRTLKNKYNCPVGYSGHETGMSISYAAVALGATSLERHITLNKAMYGSDQPASVEPAVLKILVGGIKKIEKALGDGIKQVHPDEVPIAQKLREHLPTSSIQPPNFQQS